MPEYPEIACRTAEMNSRLVGKTIYGIEVAQPKCLNTAPEDFTAALDHACFEQFFQRGKWIEGRTDRGWLLLNMGMGGESILTDRSHLPLKYRLLFDFTDYSSLAVNFWWFGYAHFVPLRGLQDHSMTARLGPNALEVSEAEFVRAISGQKGRVKTVLLDQAKIAGIGNAYIHDILFLAKLHPLRITSSLSEPEIRRLYHGMRKALLDSIEKGGAEYELNLDGVKGGFRMEDVLVGYREGQPCPVCQTPILKIKTGGTSSFICPSCQPEK
jgi:formamidopyrimidine-DNA glycosylase